MVRQKITYLFGAGASIKAVPIVSGFTKGLYELWDTYNRLNLNGIGITLTTSELSTLKRLLEDIKWLHEMSKKFYSIDTLAKQLYLTNNIIDLDKLKKTLSIYLTIVQGSKAHDLRYDLFFANLLNTDGTKLKPLPSNINILSWNYDYQIELSISQFHTNVSFNPSVIEDFIDGYPRQNKHPYTGSKEMLDFIATPENIPKGFALFKLNGTAGKFINQGKIIERDIIKFSDKIDYGNLIKKMNSYCDMHINGSIPNIQFAWESEQPIPKCTKAIAKESTKDTNILVVIGYSFPTFNREIDREIINNMKGLRKIYFQIPEDSSEGVIQRFQAIVGSSTIKIEAITNCDEFFIPYEF
jgi:hypothetical protein